MSDDWLRRVSEITLTSINKTSPPTDLRGAQLVELHFRRVGNSGCDVEIFTATFLRRLLVILFAHPLQLSGYVSDDRVA